MSDNIGSNDWASSSSDWNASGDEFEVEITEDFDDAQKKAEHLRDILAAKKQQVERSMRQVYCTECGRQNEAHYKFCLGCGATIIVPDQTKAPVQKVQMTSAPPPAQHQMSASEAQKSRGVIVVSMAITLFLVIMGMIYMATMN